MCLECYSHAVVRENGERLSWSMCRNTCSVSATTTDARHERGGEAVSRAFHAAPRGWDSVLSTSRAALEGQAHQPRTFRDIFYGVIVRHAIVSTPCACRFHRRCAVGHVADRLQSALDACSDRIECAHPGLHAGAHNPSIGALLRQVTRLASSGSEEAKRSIASRVSVIEGRLEARGLQLKIIDLVEDKGEADTGDQSQRPVPLPSGSPPASPDPQPRADNPEWIPRPRLFPMGAVPCGVSHQGGGSGSDVIQAACSCWIHRDCARIFVENNVFVGCSNGSGIVPCPNPAAHNTAESVLSGETTFRTVPAA